MDEETEPTPAPTTSAESSAAPSSKDLDLDGLLREYEEQAGGKSEQAVQPPAPAASVEQPDDPTQQLGELREWAEGIEYERLARREDEDSAATFAQAETYLEGIDHLPPDFAKRWLTAEYGLDAELHHAWNNRHESADAMWRCQNAIRRACVKMRKQAEAMPDPDATADRALVVAAITHGRASGPIEQPAPNLSKMSDQEFRDYTEKNFGFSTL